MSEVNMNHLNHLRQSLGVSIRGLASAIDITFPTLQHWLKGQETPDQVVAFLCLLASMPKVDREEYLDQLLDQLFEPVDTPVSTDS